MTHVFDSLLSQRIRISRVVCIFFMTFVHVHPGWRDVDYATRGIGFFDGVHRFVTDVLGRCAVPLLSIIAGYLLVESLSRQNHGAMILNKIKTLLVPMVLWNVFLVSLVLLYNGITHRVEAGLPVTWLEWGNAIFAITAPPANQQLAFLRDVFACSVLSPFLIFCARHFPVPALLGLAIVVVTGVKVSLVLNGQVLFFFFIGLVVRLRLGRGIDFSRYATLLVVGFFVAAGVRMLTGVLCWQACATVPPVLLHFIDSATRLMITAAFWQATVYLVRWRIGSFIARMDRYVFIFFCSHVVVFKGLSPFAEPIFGGYYSPYYPIYFFIQPIIGLAAAIICYEVLLRVHKPLLVLLCGKRVGFSSAKREPELQGP